MQLLEFAINSQSWKHYSLIARNQRYPPIGDYVYVTQAIKMTKLEPDTTKPTLVETGEYQGRPFRRYTDDTVKAATSQGWVAFQNFEALRSYHNESVQQRQRAKSQKSPFSALKRLLPRAQAN